MPGSHSVRTRSELERVGDRRDAGLRTGIVRLAARRTGNTDAAEQLTAGLHRSLARRPQR